jgi:hypothetical protein
MRGRSKRAESQGRAARFAVLEPPDQLSLDRHMFIEDLQVRTIPSRWRSDEPPVKLEGTEEECARLGDVCASLGGDHYRPEENVTAALEQIVLHLAHHGQVLFELLRDGNGSVVGFWPFSPHGVYRLPGIYLQIVPRQSSREVGTRYVVLQSANVWRTEMPCELGGMGGYVATLNAISRWPSLGPDFYTEDIKRQELPRDFNFADYRKAFEAHRYRATRTWGWNGRDWSLQYITEYYQFHRFLTFRWAQAVLRSHIIREFNRLLKQIGSSALVVLEGLPSPEEILKARDRMALGEIDFAEASRITAPAKEGEL